MDSALAASKYRSIPHFAERRAGHIVLQDHARRSVLPEYHDSEACNTAGAREAAMTRKEIAGPPGLSQENLRRRTRRIPASRGVGPLLRLRRLALQKK